MTSYVFETASALEICYNLVFYSTMASVATFILLTMWCIITKGVCKISYEDGNLTGNT